MRAFRFPLHYERMQRRIADLEEALSRKTDDRFYAVVGGSLFDLSGAVYVTRFVEEVEGQPMGDRTYLTVRARVEGISGDRWGELARLVQDGETLSFRGRRYVVESFECEARFAPFDRSRGLGPLPVVDMPVSIDLVGVGEVVEP